MTKKRDLKRHIRERQARTGEAYTTAREHVLAAPAEPEAPTEPEPPAELGPPTIDVVDVIDVSDQAAQLGLTCRIGMFPELAAKVDSMVVLERLRGALLATTADPAMERWRAVMLRGERPTPPKHDLTSWTHHLASRRRFGARVVAGIGGVSDDGQLLALHLNGRDGVVVVIASLSLYPRAIRARGPAVLLTVLDPTRQGPRSIFLL
jgi:hypothetical protein